MKTQELLQGVTLEAIVVSLEAHYGWAALGAILSIRCFTDNPSLASSLKFLRRTPWARSKVEQLYCQLVATGRMSPATKKAPE